MSTSTQSDVLKQFEAICGAFASLSYNTEDSLFTLKCTSNVIETAILTLENVITAQTTEEGARIINQDSRAGSLERFQRKLRIVGVNTERQRSETVKPPVQDVKLDAQVTHDFGSPEKLSSDSTAQPKNLRKAFHILRIPKDRPCRLSFRLLADAPDVRINGLFLDSERNLHDSKWLAKAYSLKFEEYNEFHQTWVRYSGDRAVSTASQQLRKLPKLDNIAFRTTGQQSRDYVFPEKLKDALKGQSLTLSTQVVKGTNGSVAVSKGLNAYESLAGDPKSILDCAYEPLRPLAASNHGLFKASANSLAASQPSAVDEWPTLLSTVSMLLIKNTKKYAQSGTQGAVTAARQFGDSQSTVACSLVPVPQTTSHQYFEGFRGSWIEEDEQIVDKLQPEEQDIERVFWRSGRLQMARKYKKPGQVSNQEEQKPALQSPIRQCRRDVHRLIQGIKEIVNESGKGGKTVNIEIQIGQSLVSGLPNGIEPGLSLQTQEVESLYTSFETEDTDRGVFFSNQLSLTEQAFEDTTCAISDAGGPDAVISSWYELTLESPSVAKPRLVRLNACGPGKNIVGLDDHVCGPKTMRGAVYLHMPHKPCDARFVVWEAQEETTVAVASSRDEGFSKLMNSLYARNTTDADGPELWMTQQASTCDWVIQRVQLLTRYSFPKAAACEGLHFCATRVCDLAIIRRRTDDGKHLMCAFMKNPAKMTEEKRQWYEFSLHYSRQHAALGGSQHDSQDSRSEQTMADVALSGLFHQVCVIMDNIDAVKAAGLH